MTRPAVLAGSLLLAALATGCQSTWTNRPDHAAPEIIPGRTTKAEVISALGTPQSVRGEGDRSVLTWSTRRIEGSGFGLGSLLLNFSVRDTQVVPAKFDVVFGPDGRVIRVREGGLGRVDRPGPWPFD